MCAYPRINAHIVAESLGYASPIAAAQILKDAKEGRPNYSEWVLTCYRGNSRKLVENAIRHRHMHKGYMAWYEKAFALVKDAIETGNDPPFASWF